MEPFALESGGARLKALLWRPRGRPLLVFCHGFPGRNFNDAVARELAALGLGALLFRYRGAHGSEGAYSFRHNEEDILAAIDAARPLATHGLGLLGYSMGGCHATRTLGRDGSLADFLVLQAPVASVGDLRRGAGAELFADFLASGRDVIAADPADLIAEALALGDDDEPVRLAKTIRVPTLVVHGGADDEVPPSHGRLLYDALGGPKRYAEIPGADHYFRGHERTVAREIDGFVREHAERGR